MTVKRMFDIARGIVLGGLALFSIGYGVNEIVNKDSHHHFVSDNGAARAAYIRDKSHHCKVIVRTEPGKQWSYVTESITSSKGRTLYNCDGLFIGLTDGEVQP